MMNLTLLAAQTAIGDTLAGGNPVLTPVSGEAQMDLWDMALKGGWIMAVLAVLSVVCFYIFFERLAVIRKAGKDDPMFMERIRDYIRTGEIKSAINYCRITNTPSARMIEKGITRMGRPVADVQAAIENTGNIEVAKLENGLPIVATISGGAQAEWKEFEIRFEYKKEFDPNQKYRLSIAFTSSKDGDKFWGAPGSELIVDDIELVVE